MASWRKLCTESLCISNSLVRACLAEFLGTFFLVFIGTSANVQNSLVTIDATSRNIAWGIGFAFAICLATFGSEGHINPAISFTALLFGDISFIRFLLYVPSQIAGAFVGAASAFFGHFDNIRTYERRSNNSSLTIAGLFATYPSSQMSTIGCIVDQLIGSMILSGMIGMITEERRRLPKPIQPLLIGSTMSMIAMTFGSNCGFANNPARDIGPRLFLLITGYGWKTFTAYANYFWIPLIIPMIGAPLGAIIYQIFVGMHGWNEKLEVSAEQSHSRDIGGDYRTK